MRLLAYFTICILLFSCNREKNITVELPTYTSQPVVEFYLVPGKPFRLLLTESAGYFDPPQVTPIEGATVEVVHAGKVYYPTPQPFGLNPVNKKYYNYSTDENTVVPLDFDSDFYVSIKDKNGRIIEGRTTIMHPVEIDTISFLTDDPDKAAIQVKFQDDPATKDYYRIIGIQDSLDGEGKWDLVFNDDAIQTEQGGIGSNYIFFQGSKVIIQLFHISKEYYDFVTSTKNASDSNGNPFAQPSKIMSNVTGGIGIITGLQPSQKELIVK
ncbi:MAG: DUF4249 domain-containing protein [Sporocytophaga sp.]|uniref:DUF4249 domain-containing protein n=1 Tax=Sporocytophaga sp. TaxID=2231183 RepID=UPI001B225A24|nr:DUF4249 domain-containing protein [Sporocytophaga sp.]MBO9701240.1 DUF4249 domain-containing protein [Sporocytophaga sp.]